MHQNLFAYDEGSLPVRGVGILPMSGTGVLPVCAGTGSRRAGVSPTKENRTEAREALPASPRSDGPSGPPPPADGGWPVALLIAAGIWALYLFTASQTHLFDRDEPRFCRCTMEMIESGDYLVPRFNGELRPDKPVLVYWLMSLPVRLFGPTEPACRFFSTLGTAVTCLIVWWMARRLFGGRAGPWAMTATALNPLLLVLGTLATADGVMLPFLTLALASFVASATRGVRPLHIVLLAVGLAGTMLAKSVMGLVPAAMIGAAFLLGRKSMGLKWTYPLWCLLALAAAAAAFAAWAVPCNQATGGNFVAEHFGHHVGARTGRALEGHGGNRWLWLWFYVPVVLIGFFPWVVFLLPAAPAVWRARLGGRVGRAVLIGATLPVFAAMSLVATKLPHYIVPIWPGLAMTAAAFFERARRGELHDRDRGLLKHALRLFAILGAAGGLAAIVGPWFADLPGLRAGGAFVGLVLLTATFTTFRAGKRGGAPAAATVLAVGMALIQIAFVLGIHRNVSRTMRVPELARQVNAAMPAEAPLATYGFDEPSLYFYAGRNVRSFNDEHAPPAEVVAWLREPAPGVLVTRRRDLPSLEKAAGGPLSAPIIASVRNLNFGRMRWEDLIALKREEEAVAPETRLTSRQAENMLRQE